MKTVLIVEDDKVLSLLLGKMVQKLDLSLIGNATKGREAIEKVRDLKPDLILMDIMLEDDVDGIDAVLTLRKENIETPVIFITGNSDAYNRERAKSTNYVRYLIKPISFDLLKESLAEVNW
tara:strand:- start:161305 stop:161667 length:363 start_codon:yes stop_codon:yes gene_type:complete